MGVLEGFSGDLDASIGLSLDILDGLTTFTDDGTNDGSGDVGRSGLAARKKTRAGTQLPVDEQTHGKTVRGHSVFFGSRFDHPDSGEAHSQ